MFKRVWFDDDVLQCLTSDDVVASGGNARRETDEGAIMTKVLGREDT
jgi:hypothetical protein